MLTDLRQARWWIGFAAVAAVGCSRPSDGDHASNTPSVAPSSAASAAASSIASASAHAHASGAPMAPSATPHDNTPEHASTAGSSMPSMTSMMGAMKPTPSASAALSATAQLPAGTPHVYHVGSTGFFLDYDSQLEFTAPQRAALSAIRDRAVADIAASDTKIENAEQALWLLTAADKPDIKQIEAKVREIDRERGDQRLAFIRAVGSAVAVLTEAQKRTLLMPSTAAPAPNGGAMPMPAPGGSAPAPMPGMGGGMGGHM